MRCSLDQLLGSHGYAVSSAVTATEGLHSFEHSDVDLVLLDLGLPDMDGLDLLSRIRQVDEHVAVVVLTGQNDIATIVEAMKRGADNFLLKPTTQETLLAAVERAVEQRRLRRSVLLSRAQSLSGDPGEPIGQSQPMLRLRELALQVADTDSSVVLLGESGTGKGMIARLIHQHSRRAGGTFTDVHCAALPAPLLESELFGHERGSFTDAHERKLGLFEVAQGGTLFLDEVGEMETAVQGKLLKALEDKRFRRVGGVREIACDVRIIAATNRDLMTEVENGRFRRDLYYRLNVFQITCPPLRDRREDILDIAIHFVRALNPRLCRQIEGIDDRASRLLLDYSWPGNIRELRNVIERAMILARGPLITVSQLSPELHPTLVPHSGDRIAPLSEVERAHIRHALEKTGGNLKRAAQLLGIARSTLYAKLKEHAIDAPPQVM